MTADLAVFASFGLIGCSAITALTVQNTCGVRGVQTVSPELLRATLLGLEEDLYPAGIKIGMLAEPELVSVVAEWLKRRSAASLARRPKVVLDPVLRSSSGHALLSAPGLDALCRQLLPQVEVVTPNWAELALLTGTPVTEMAEAKEAALQLVTSYPGLHVVVTGGDRQRPLDLLAEPSGAIHEIAGEHIETQSTHGTGCAFSSALLAGMVHGQGPLHAAVGAKRFVEGALRGAPGLGSGKGPMELLWPLLGQDVDSLKG